MTLVGTVSVQNCTGAMQGIEKVASLYLDGQVIKT